MLKQGIVRLHDVSVVDLEGVTLLHRLGELLVEVRDARLDVVHNDAGGHEALAPRARDLAKGAHGVTQERVVHPIAEGVPATAGALLHGFTTLLAHPGMAMAFLDDGKMVWAEQFVLAYDARNERLLAVHPSQHRQERASKERHEKGVAPPKDTSLQILFVVLVAKPNQQPPFP